MVSGVKIVTNHVNVINHANCHRSMTYWHCLLGARQLLSYRRLGQSFPPLGILRKKRPSCCKLQRCSFGDARLTGISTLHIMIYSWAACNSRIAGNLPPDVPTMDSLPTLPRRRRSKRVNPTTPTFLSDFEAPPPTNPVVYSPVPT